MRKTLFQFAVISDSHFRLATSAAEGGYSSNRLANSRNRYVVECLNRLEPDFVVHLGDIVHPIPALPSHADAVRLAQKTYAGLKAPLHMVPGNHDLGDKPNAWMPAPVVNEANHLAFEENWGAPYRSFDFQGCHFILLDTPVLNSGLEREEDQRNWLEDDLASNTAAGRRAFVLLHYPPFLNHPDESSHYDNIDEPARSWLLDLLKKHHVEAVFCGHVHNFFYNRLDQTAFYVVPSTAFVRPEYADLAGVAPGEEFGRDNSATLGFFMVRVHEDGHAVDPVRTYGREAGEATPEPPGRPCPLGVSLRHPWAGSIELPTDGLDEFTRKMARRDGMVQALWELGITRIRIPLGDIASEDGRARVADLVARGHAFTVFSVGPPDDGTVELMAGCADLVAVWEVIGARESLPKTIERIAEVRGRLPFPVHLAPVVPMKPLELEGPSFQHFGSHGFAPHGDEALSGALDHPGFASAVDGITFRVTPFERPGDGIAAVAGWARPGLAVNANLQLPRVDEGIAADDDASIAAHVTEAAKAAAAHPRVTVFLDTFMDHDRGYYPRNGLIDRRFHPRAAFHALRNLSFGP